MFVSKPLLALLLCLFVFIPGFESWWRESGASWYRPFYIYLPVIMITFITWYRGRHNDL